MSFLPIIQLVKVPRDSKSFFFQDATQNYPTSSTGWGAPNAPADASAITNIWGENQPYGEEPVRATDVIGLLDAPVQVKVYIPDGVNMIHAFYGVQESLDVSVSEDRLSLVVDIVDLTDTLDSVAAVNINNTFPIRIKAIEDGNTIILEEPLPGTDTFSDTLYKYYYSELRILVLNCAEKKIVDRIAHLPVRANKCENGMDILDDVLLKIGAQIAYECDNFSKAHEAARLVCGSQPYQTSNCSSCG